MNRTRGETAVLMAGLGGVLLIVSLFLDWYSFATYTVTAWSAFEVWDLVLAVLALAVIVAAAADIGWWRGPTHSVGLIGLGVAALVIVASQLIEPPPAALHAGIGDGGWLGLVGAGLMAVGAAMAESGVRLSIDRGGPRSAGPAAGPPRATRSWRRPGGAADAPVSAPLVGPVDVPRRRPRAPRPPDAAAYDDREVRPPPPPPPRV
jgi:hypothetical protein